FGSDLQNVPHQFGLAFQLLQKFRARQTDQLAARARENRGRTRRLRQQRQFSKTFARAQLANDQFASIVGGEQDGNASRAHDVRRISHVVLIKNILLPRKMLYARHARENLQRGCVEIFEQRHATQELFNIHRGKTRFGHGVAFSRQLESSVRASTIQIDNEDDYVDIFHAVGIICPCEHNSNLSYHECPTRDKWGSKNNRAAHSEPPDWINS